MPERKARKMRPMWGVTNCLPSGVRPLEWRKLSEIGKSGSPQPGSRLRTTAEESAALLLELKLIPRCSGKAVPISPST